MTRSLEMSCTTLDGMDVAELVFPDVATDWTDGQLELQLRDRTVHLSPGEFFIVPRGVEHRPIAKQLVSIVLFEPATVRNTGEVVDDRTIEPGDLERI